LIDRICSTIVQEFLYRASSTPPLHIYLVGHPITHEGKCFITLHPMLDITPCSSTISFHLDLWWCRYGRVWCRQRRL